MGRKQYNCAKCPGYCCSYPIIGLKKKDVLRLAAHFGIGFRAAVKKFTRKDPDGEEDYLMRRKDDEYFGRICQFFDTEARRCTVYTARPSICRVYPSTGRCGYYDFLASERAIQDDPELVALTDNR
jgi:uncharacterized protein